MVSQIRAHIHKIFNPYIVPPVKKSREKTASFVNRLVDAVGSHNRLDHTLKLVSKNNAVKADLVQKYKTEVTAEVQQYLENKVAGSRQSKSLKDAVSRLVLELESKQRVSNPHDTFILTLAIQAAKECLVSSISANPVPKKTYSRPGELLITSSSTETSNPSLGTVCTPLNPPVDVAVAPGPIIHKPADVPVLSAVAPGLNAKANDIACLIHTICDPKTDDQIAANLEAIKIFVDSNMAHFGRFSVIVSEVMKHYNRAIDALIITNNIEGADQLTLKKFACASAFIQTSFDQNMALPSPSRFGLMRGFKTRKRVDTQHGEQKPAIPTKGGELVADNRASLGEGAFGRIKTAVKGDADFAVKRVLLNPYGCGVDYDRFLSVAKEVFYAQKLARHSDLFLGVHDVWCYEDGKLPKLPNGSRPSESAFKVGIAMDVAHEDGQSRVFDHCLPKDQLAYFLTLAQALDTMHQAGLAHQDFKLANSVVMNDGQVKLIDFGFVVPIHVESPRLFDTSIVGGSLPAPEALKVRQGQLEISEISFDKLDVYAFGKSLESLNLIDFSIENKKRITAVCTSCCAPDPNNRPSMSTVVKQLRDILTSPNQ